jgi:Amt family ammonium transporter
VIFGFSDFAGSGIVHMAGAAAALAGVLLLGARKGKYTKPTASQRHPRRQPAAGHARHLHPVAGLVRLQRRFRAEARPVVESANAVAVVFLNTNAAAAGGLVFALITARLLFGKADLTMALNGALAGLVAITAEPSTPTPLAATLIGAIGGVLVVFSIITLDKLKIDDPVGAISVHGVVGLWGLLAGAVTNGENSSFTGQLIGAATIFGWVFVTSLRVLAGHQDDHGHPRQRGRGVRGCRPRRVRPGGLPGVRHQLTGSTDLRAH